MDLNKSIISTVTKIKISNSKLSIEIGTYNRTPLQDRICPLCEDGIEDEFHFLIKCKSLELTINEFFTKLENIVPSFSSMSDEEKFNFILKSNDFDICSVCAIGINDMYCENVTKKQIWLYTYMYEQIVKYRTCRNN